MRKSDVIVVGAGVSGLVAAHELAASGFSVRILEGRERIGGRLMSVTEPTLRAPIELGAEFIHGFPRDTWRLIRLADLQAVQLPGSHVLIRNGKRITGIDVWDVISRVIHSLESSMRASSPEREAGQGAKLAGNVGAGPPGDLSFREALQRARDRGLSDELELDLVHSYVESFQAADPEKISARSLVSAELKGEDRSEQLAFRVVGGYQRLIEFLADPLFSGGCHLELGVPCLSISWKRGLVYVETEKGRFQAGALIYTLPIGVWKSRVSPVFSPVLFEKEKALRRMEMGPVLKLIFRFKNQFWKDRAEFEDLSFIHSMDTPFATCWTAAPGSDPTLSLWVGGPAAEWISELIPWDIRELGIRSLVGMLGFSRNDIEDRMVGWHLHNWERDPFSKGAYSYVGVGGMEAQRVLAEPVESTLFFAGEGTYFEGQTGTVDAAIATGTRAAQQVRHALGPRREIA